jgi:TonB family protein
MRGAFLTSLGVLTLLGLISSAAADIGKAKIGRFPDTQDFYPAASKAAGHQGKPTVRVCVNPDAQIESAEVLESSGHEELDGAAVSLARNGRYEPERVDNTAIKSCVSFRVNFSILSNEPTPASPQTVAELISAAEKGSSNAQVNLGVRYSRGDGVVRDDAEAFKWFSAAAEQGLATGQLNVGVSYHNGKGVEKDSKKAEQYYLLAASQGSATAAKYLGYLYNGGDLGKRDPVEAAKWLKKAAEKRDKDAAYSLGWIYFRGGIVPQKTPDAYFWFLVAERLGHPDGERLRRKAAQVTSPTDIDEAQKMMQRWDRVESGT